MQGRAERKQRKKSKKRKRGSSPDSTISSESERDDSNKSVLEVAEERPGELFCRGLREVCRSMQGLAPGITCISDMGPVE
eukprot:6476065-Amphidinium_carterae.1